MTLKFGLQVNILLILLFLCLLVVISLLNECSFSLRDHFLVFVVPNSYICLL